MNRVDVRQEHDPLAALTLNVRVHHITARAGVAVDLSEFSEPAFGQVLDAVYSIHIIGRRFDPHQRFNVGKDVYRVILKIGENSFYGGSEMCFLMKKFFRDYSLIRSRRSVCIPPFGQMLMWTQRPVSVMGNVVE